MSTCTICGVQFQGKQPYYPYKCCGAHECRLAIRRRAGRKSAKTVKDKKKMFTVVCLVCSKEFNSESRFIRTCPECKDNRRDHPVYAEQWGKVI